MSSVSEAVPAIPAKPNFSLWLRQIRAIFWLEIEKNFFSRPELALLLSELSSTRSVGRRQIHFRTGHIDSAFHRNDNRLNAAVVPAALLFGEHKVFQWRARAKASRYVCIHHDTGLCRLWCFLHSCRIVCA